jgi:integrase/recombinase XerC
MKLSPAVEAFIAEVRTTRAKTTAATYHGDLRTLVAFARPDSVGRFTDKLLSDYLAAAQASGAAQASMCRKAAALRQFSKWGVRKALWSRDFAADLPTLKRPDGLPRPFSEDEIGRLMAHPLTGAQNVLRALLFHTGGRISPLAQIRLGDVSFSPLHFQTPTGDVVIPGAIYTTNKGNKRMLVMMTPELAAILAAWVSAHPGKPYDPLLASPRGGCYSRATLERWAKSWGDSTGVPNCIPHRFRHTYATAKLREGVDLPLIQKLMGHANIATTVRYTHVADVALARAVLGSARIQPQDSVTPST